MSETKFSSWKLKLSRHKHRYCLLAFVLFCFTCVAIGVAVGIGLRVRDFSGGTLTDDVIDQDPRFRTVVIDAELFSIDPLAKTMGINWIISDDTCLVQSLNQPCTTVSIFFDTNLLQLGDSSNTNLTNEIPTTPIFTWDPNISNNGRSGIPLFRTTSTLIDVGIRKAESSLQDYPFDTYGTELFLFGTDPMNNQVNIEVETAGIAVGFKTISDTSGSSENGLYDNFIQLERSGLIKTYVVCIVLGIWAITLAFVGSAVKIMFQYRQPKEVFAVPIASLFAFPSLRGTMPGAPVGFGATIDFVGILPCLAIITATSVVLFGYMMLQTNDDNKKISYAPSEFFKKKDKRDVESGYIAEAQELPKEE